jgi:pimeloyl-ACP methyl ester carboxylesterase
VICDTPATHEGVVDRGGIQIHYQVFGQGEQTILLLPTWSIVHSDFWRRQVPHFARTYSVVVFDGRGNGASDRPTDSAAYADDLFADDALAVMDALDVERAIVASVSAGAGWQLVLAAEHPERVSAAVFIAPAIPIGESLPERAAGLAVFNEPQESYDGWLKFNRHYWTADWPDFLEFFFAQCFTEPDSQDEIAHFVGMGLETTPEVILATAEAPGLDAERTRSLAAAIRCPTLVIHGDHDALSSVTRGEELAALAVAELVVMPGVGHEPQCRWPEQVNGLLDDFFERTIRSAQEAA